MLKLYEHRPSWTALWWGCWKQVWWGWQVPAKPKDLGPEAQTTSCEGKWNVVLVCLNAQHLGIDFLNGAASSAKYEHNSFIIIVIPRWQPLLFQSSSGKVKTELESRLGLIPWVYLISSFTWCILKGLCLKKHYGIYFCPATVVEVWEWLIYLD